MNSTDPLALLPVSFPFYYADRPSVFPGISDRDLSLAAPCLAYWSLSLFFHFLDISGWRWLDAYRIHPSEEVQSRNLATRTQVLRAVLLQQVLQTALGMLWMDKDSDVPAENHVLKMRELAGWITRVVEWLLGPVMSEKFLVVNGPELVYFTYWWGIPIVQFVFAMFVMDTWQYCLHRGMHMNKFLYKHFHSVHHRLYVPYAFGALYNHPIEGFVLDSLGAVLAESLSSMTVRQATLLFAISTFKTVDDHCGYRFPFDPLQMMSANNADYHDIHHQVIGIKANFSQPFFIHWDYILGTRLTRKDIEARRKRTHEKTEKTE